MRKLTKKIIALVLTVFMISAMLPMGAFAAEAAEETEYVLYPIPHTISYASGSYELKDINVIYGDDMDDATKARLNETAALRGLTVTEGTAGDSSKTNVYVAINGSGDAVENYIITNYDNNGAIQSDLFTKTDAYFLASDNGEIVVLGKDVDSCFYGLTTLYQIFGQLESNTLRNFTINDYADVASRGFIEGYYGNPWSTQDRINLMTWGGYYKLNSYFYAPKDDPKHNAKWRELYTDEEIATLIKPLADAGNASKCRFVYALHPYMHNPITDSNYDESMATLKAKFMQVIDAGVRQIAILADDAGNQGGTHYTKMLTDMTAWINELRKQEKYADLKLLLPFVTQEYMYFGESYYRNFPENIQIVMTGGQVWGFCSPSFTNTFYNNVGRGVYLWINWPCTDNSKNHLIMGGYSDFLQVGVDPNKVEGIVLNPMQQSEPSKVAIFGNACYTWNIWETKEEADGAWETSFACVDHNTVVPNAASDALKELSKHMIDQTRFEDNPNVLEESVVLRTELQAFQNKLNAGTYTEADIDSLVEEFTILQDAAKIYREQGNTDIKNQIEPWLGNWDDTTVSVLSYLNALKAILNNEGDAAVWGYYAAGQAAYESSRNHPLWYLDHYEYAESGYRFIVPFMKALGSHLSEVALDIVYPAGRPSGGAGGGTGGGAVTGMTAFEGNNPSHYSGSLSNMVDGSTSTSLWYSDYARVGQYVGVDLGKNVIIGKVVFTQDSGDHFTDYTLQYSTDGVTYRDYKNYTDTVLNVDLSGSGVEARYLRFYSNSTTSTWIKIHEIAVYEASATTVMTNSDDLASWQTRVGAETAQVLTTGSMTLAPNEYLGMDLGRIKDLQTVTAEYDAVTRASGALTLQVSKNNVDWVDIESGATTEDARYVRLINKTDADVTVNLTEFRVTSREVAAPSLLESNIGINSSWGVSEDCRDNGAAFDGDLATHTEFADFVTTGQYIIYDLGQVRDIRKLEIYCADSAVNYIRDAKVQISNDLTNWTDVFEIGDGVENTGEASVKCIDSDAGYSQSTSSYPNYVSIEGTVEETPARYIRILMTAPNSERAVLFTEIEINEGEYVSATNDPTFVASAIEVQGYVPQNMIDGDLTTSWKADTTEAGSLLYTFSDNLTANRIHVVQQTPSNAKISLYVENDGVREWVEMGNLDESLVKLVCENDLNLALKIEWEAGNAPMITEIVRYSAEQTTTTEVTLQIGETKTFTIDGDHTDADVSALDQDVATVTLKGVATSSEKVAGNIVTSLVSGNEYLLVNTRAGKTVVNTSSSTSETADGSMAGLSLNGTTATVVDAAVWTITATDTANVYNVQSSNGKYMTIGANAGGLVDAAQPITMVYANNNWTLMQNSAYLNDAGGAGTTASGWQNAAAATDAGSQWTIYEVVSNDVIGSTEITFTGVDAGTTSVVIDNVRYEITVLPDGPVEEVTVKVDETKVIELAGVDLSDDVDDSKLDESVATVTVTGNAGSDEKTAEAVSPASAALGDGIYMLVNTRANKTMTSAPATWGEYSGLALDGTADTIADAACWIVTGTGTAGQYTVQDMLTGKYLTLNAFNHAELGTDVATVTIETNGETFTIRNGAYYLNNAGGQHQCAFGWDGEGYYDAPTDSGSQWALYKVTGGPSTTITIVGVAEGKTSVKVGDTTYKITVIGEEACGHANTEVRGAVEATCEEPGYTGDTYCVDCGEKIADGTATDALGHAWGEPVFTWAEDYSAATAAFTCANDAEHTHEEAAVITSEETEADCVNPAGILYTATVTFEGKTYTDEKKSAEGETGTHNYVNGFCTGCDDYEPAELVDGVYQIGNGGQLYWFAELVKEDPDADAILIADIVVNEGTMSADAADARVWNTIGYQNSSSDYVYYNGTFDGKDHSISGLYYNQDKSFDDQYIGLFGVIDEDGVVKNIELENTYFCGRYWVGGIAGLNKGTIDGCSSDATIYVDEKNCAGGIAGESTGTVNDCVNTGDVSGVQYVGGIAGQASGTVTNCTNFGTVSYTDSYGSYMGGIVGGTYSDLVITNCYNTGDVTGKSSMGALAGILGRADGSSGRTVTISHCYNTGAITGDFGVGGVVGHVENVTIDIDDCYNTGDITAKFGQKATFAGGIAGRIETEASTIDDCHNVGTVKASRLAGGIIGGEGPVITNCYYLTGCAADATTTQYGVGALNRGTTTPDTEATVAATADEFASGEITWLLNHETDEGELVWFQIVGTDAYPKFEGDAGHAPKADQVIRLAGEHRWNTAIKVADEMKANLGLEKFDAIIIASGNDFADALAGSYLSTVKNAPILLAWGQGGAFEYLDTDNINYIKANLAEDGVVYILGGEKAVPALYETELAEYEVKRLGGADRFETNILILEEAGIPAGSEVLVCTSTNFADSLSASATAKPILLAFNEFGALFGKQPEFLAKLEDCTFTVIGGENAVGEKLVTAIEAYGEVTRLAGENRFETSVLVAEKYFEAPETAVLAYAWNYPDGLCGGSLAYSLGAPLILTMTGFEDEAVAYAESVGITAGVVLGGDGLISDEAVRAIFAMAAEDEIILK